MPKTAKKNANAVVATITLYGTSQHGAGWLAKPGMPFSTNDADQIVGDGSLKLGRSFTEAVWQAVDALRVAGIDKGNVAIFAPSGQRMAIADLCRVPYFGDLQWQPAEVLTLDMETILAMATEPC